MRTFHKPIRRSDPDRRTEDGIVFASIGELRYYRKLKLLREAGVVVYFLRQVPFYLPGGVVYRCDFMEVLRSGEIRFTDVKGFVTPVYRTKKALVEGLYPIKIMEVEI